MVSSTWILVLYFAPCLARNVNRDPTWDGCGESTVRMPAVYIVAKSMPTCNTEMELLFHFCPTIMLCVDEGSCDHYTLRGV